MFVLAPYVERGSKFLARKKVPREERNFLARNLGFLVKNCFLARSGS